MTRQTKQAGKKLGSWRTPTPRELEQFKIWWKKNHDYEPRPHEIAGFDPDWTILRRIGQEPPIPNWSPVTERHE